MWYPGEVYSYYIVYEYYDIMSILHQVCLLEQLGGFKGGGLNSCFQGNTVTDISISNMQIYHSNSQVS